MSNQPKISYRSDSTGCVYHMMQHAGTSFTIVVITWDGHTVDTSPLFVYRMPWRDTINLFFDVVTVHINHKRWE